MATAKIKLVKKAAAKFASQAKAKAGDPPPAEYALQDNQDGSVTVFGVDAAGAQVDISGVASLTPAPTSSNTAVLTVDGPSGMTCVYHGVAPGTATVTLTATWTDGSVGPFTIEDPCTVSGSAAVGITVTHGTPTIR